MYIAFMLSALMAASQPVGNTADTETTTRTTSPKEVSLTSDRLTPELLWEMGRVGDFVTSPDGRHAVYSVSYYSVKENKGHHVLYLMDLRDKSTTLLTTTAENETSATFIKGGTKIAFLSARSGSNQIWEMNLDGTDRRQLSHEEGDIAGYRFSPDGRRVILIKDVPFDGIIQQNDADLPQATGMVINDLMYKHWDHYVTSVPHPFVAIATDDAITDAFDLLAGEPFESPMLPFGGIEQLAWSPDSRTVAYTCRKKTGRDYAISTDSDIFLFDLDSRSTRNLCKPEGYKAPELDPTRSLASQQPRQGEADLNLGYDQNPSFSPDGKYIAWSSMERDGYESDRTRLCVMELATGQKRYVTETFESGVNQFLWAENSKRLYFTGVWHGKTNIYQTDLEGRVKALTDDVADYTLAGLTADGRSLIATRQSMSHPAEVFRLDIGRNGLTAEQLTFENKAIFDKLTTGEVRERWVKTSDGKQEQCWVIYPPHFDPAKKYPTLLYCEGGPQSPVSQFWSVRWNFQVMAAHDYIIIAPNRRGLPGYGMEWLEQISGDYSGQCMKDYLAAIDDICREPYVDKERLGCVGASFGGYSVYWLAGNHEGRFKCFIAHDGIYNTQQQYVETEELWFPNWDMGRAPWIKDEKGKMAKVYETSPHLYVDKWDAPILCIHGQKDFRIEYTQAESAFTAARLRGIEAQMLLLPDENHWVLKPQNGILWQRTFFRWLDRWLKQ